MRKLKLLAVVLALVMLFTLGLSACNDPCAKGHNYQDGVCTECGEEDPDYVPPVDPPAPPADACADGHEYERFVCKVCGKLDPAVLSHADGTTLRTSIAHDSKKTTITFDDASVIPEGGLVLADGKTYNVGDFKPVWAAVQTELKITLDNVYESQNVQNSYRAWRTANFEGVDVLLGNAADIAEDGKLGKLVNLADYLEAMPNFAKFLEENPLVMLSIISDTDQGAIYYAPYFDGYDDIERYFLMRSDWVETLLDGPGDFVATTSDAFAGNAYTPYMPLTGTVVVDALSKDGQSVISLTKNYTVAGNPIVKQNELAVKNGVTLVNALRDYIDAAYNGHYGEKRSDLFCGYDAAWDADELTALLRCIVSNTFALTGQNENKVDGIYARRARLDRTANLLGIATMFGARGLNSVKDFLYFNTDGELVDARGDVEFYEAIGKMNQLYQEGLIYENFDTGSYTEQTTANANSVFMTYDYCQTQTLYNEYSNDVGKAAALAATGKAFNLTPVINPVAKYDDGGDQEYFRFTESWRGVKTQGWCISAELLNDSDKLAAALALFDYPWSEEGSVMMTYGPDSFLDGTTEYKGVQVPKMTEANQADFVELGGGNFTNYARQYLGTTFGIGFVKDQGLEYQCTTAGGRKGSLIVGQAIAKGVLRHVTPEIQENMFYTMVPTTLPTTAVEDDTINDLTGLKDNFSKSNGKFGVYIELIKNGFGGSAGSAVAPIGTTLPASAEAFAEMAQKKVSSDGMGSDLYEYIQNKAWIKALEYYNENK